MTIMIMINMVLIVIGSVRCAGVNEDEDEDEDEEFYPPEVWYFVFVHVFVLT